MIGFVEMEYGVSMVGDCIIDHGVLIVGVTLMVGIGRDGFDPLEADAAAPELRFLRPTDVDELEAADEDCCTGPAG